MGRCADGAGAHRVPRTPPTAAPAAVLRAAGRVNGDQPRDHVLLKGQFLRRWRDGPARGCDPDAAESVSMVWAVSRRGRGLASPAGVFTIRRWRGRPRSKHGRQGQERRLGPQRNRHGDDTSRVRVRVFDCCTVVRRSQRGGLLPAMARPKGRAGSVRFVPDFRAGDPLADQHPAATRHSVPRGIAAGSRGEPGEPFADRKPPIRMSSSTIPRDGW